MYSVLLEVCPSHFVCRVSSLVFLLFAWNCGLQLLHFSNCFRMFNKFTWTANPSYLVGASVQLWSYLVNLRTLWIQPNILSYFFWKRNKLCTISWRVPPGSWSAYEPFGRDPSPPQNWGKVWLLYFLGGVCHTINHCSLVLYRWHTTYFKTRTQFSQYCLCWHSLYQIIFLSYNRIVYLWCSASCSEFEQC